MMNNIFVLNFWDIDIGEYTEIAVGLSDVKKYVRKFTEKLGLAREEDRAVYKIQLQLRRGKRDFYYEFKETNAFVKVYAPTEGEALRLKEKWLLNYIVN